jgi:hypothetical protein
MNEAIKLALTLAQTMLKGIAAPFDQVLELLLPVLIDLTDHQGKVSKKIRLEIQDRLDDVLKPFIGGV